MKVFFEDKVLFAFQCVNLRTSKGDFKTINSGVDFIKNWLYIFKRSISIRHPPFPQSLTGLSYSQDITSSGPLNTETVPTVLLTFDFLAITSQKNIPKNNHTCELTAEGSVNCSLNTT